MTAGARNARSPTHTTVNPLRARIARSPPEDIMAPGLPAVGMQAVPTQTPPDHAIPACIMGGPAPPGMPHWAMAADGPHTVCLPIAHAPGAA
mmetsp:Transcript_66199/g.187030  ORF Transcript_66199/g.187030 Transcript_66199/m.187030 type:complete len:92 (-) Transcript_66199:1294-1569(-)